MNTAQALREMSKGKKLVTVDFEDPVTYSPRYRHDHYPWLVDGSEDDFRYRACQIKAVDR